MIYFKKIKWKNFLSTGNTFTEIDFTRNKSTLIVGENGAGKSTILDALSFALYSKPFRKINKPQLVNTINQKGLEVELEFSIGKREYLVKRGIKPSIFEIYQDGKLLNQDAEAKEYQEMFEKNILKLNHKSFSQIVILGSASFVPFMQLPANHRREVIEDLLDIGIFSTMNILLKEKISDNKNKLIETDYAIKGNAEKIELYKKHIATLKQNNDELIKQKRDKIVEITNNITSKQSELQELTRVSEAASESISDHSKVRAKAEKISKLSLQIANRLEKIKKDIAFFESHDDCPTCRQGIQHGHRHEIIQQNNTQVAEIQGGEQKIAEELSSLHSRLSEIDTISKNIIELNKSMSNINIQIQTWTKFISDLEQEIEGLNGSSQQIEDNNVEIQELKKQLKEAIELKEQLASDRQILDVAGVLLKDSGIKTKIIKQYIPIINKLINKYLASMDFFVKFELNENFEETIKSRFRDEFSYESFSEGEKMRIDLALLFTWRTIAKLRNSASTNLLIMDEVFDSSLDNSGTDEFLKILNTVVTDTNVFIISHKGDQLFDKFEHTIRFEKHKNFSRIA